MIELVTEGEGSMQFCIAVAFGHVKKKLHKRAWLSFSCIQTPPPLPPTRPD